MNMTKDEINFVTELVSKTIGTPASEAAALLFDVKADESGDLKSSALQILLDKDKERVAKFKTEATNAHDKGYQKAQAEALSKFEKDLKEKHGISSDKQGLELIEFLVTEKLKTTGNEQDDDKIKRSKVYQDMVQNLTKQKEEAVATEAKKFETLQSSIQKESTFKTVSELVLSYVTTELMPILPEGKTADGKSKADIQLQKFVKDLVAEYEIEVKDGKVLLSKEGKLLEDSHGKMLDIKEVTKAKASEVWDFKEGEARKGAGNSNNGGDGDKGNGNKGYQGPVPKSENEYLEMIKTAPDDATKQQITKVWVDNKPKT